MELTPKQERFCQKYIESHNASEAYRASYDAENMNNESIWTEASRLMQNPHVALRVMQLHEEHRKRHNVTVDSITKELEEARSLALQEKQASAAVTASIGKAKIHGLIVDKVAGAKGEEPVSVKHTGAILMGERIQQILEKSVR